MKESIKDKWVEALRSGKYEQCKGALKRDGGYCCLGVLADLSGLEVRGNFLLNGPIKKWSGIQSSSGKLLIAKGYVPKYTSLASLNDGRSGMVFGSLNFDEIADVIEMTWEDL